MTTYTLQIVVEGQDRASAPLGGIGGVIGRIGEIAGGILSAGILMNFARGLLDIATNAVSAYANIQSFQIGLSSLVARELRANDETLSLNDALSQSSPIVSQLTSELRNLAIQSPYRLGTIQDTFRLGMAFGFTTSEASDFTRGILTMAAGIGASDEMMGRMSYNLAQIRMQGRVTALDVRQLAMAGFDLNSALRGIGSQFGLTIEDYNDFNAAIASGQITWEQFTSGFAAYADNEFGGAAQRMSRTLQGLWSTFQDVFALSMPQLLGPALEAVSKFLGSILDRFVDFSNSEQLTQIGDRIGSFFEGFLAPLGRLVNALLDAGPASQEFISALGNILGIDLTNLRDFVNGIFGDGNWEGITTAIGYFQNGIAQFQGFIDTYGPRISSTLREVFQNTIERIATFWNTTIMPFFGGLFNQIGAWFNQNGDMISDFISNLGIFWDQLLQSAEITWEIVQTLIVGITNVLLGLYQILMQVVNGDWQGAWNSFADVVSSALSAIVNAIGLAFDQLAVVILGTTMQHILAVWAADWQQLQVICGLVWEAITTGWNEFWNRVHIAATGFLGIIAGAFTIAWNSIRDFVLSVWQGISTGIQDTWSGIVAWFTGAWNNLVSFINGLVSNFVNIGANIVNGLRQGIENAWNSFVSWVQGLFQGFVDLVHGLFEESSPSKVFADIGANLMAGMRNGIDAAASMPEVSLTQAVDSVINAGEQGIQSAYSVGEGAGSSKRLTADHSQSCYTIDAYGLSPEQVAEKVLQIFRTNDVIFQQPG